MRSVVHSEARQPPPLPPTPEEEVVEVIEEVVEVEEGEEGEEVIEEVIEVEVLESEAEPMPELEAVPESVLEPEPAPEPEPEPAPEPSLAPPPPRKLIRQVISRTRYMPRTITDEVANHVLATCKRTDPDATVTYVACETDSHVIRIRSGLGASVSALQRALRAALPLCSVRTYESALDGTLQAQVEVFSKHVEFARARVMAEERRSMRLLRTMALVCFVVGMTLWGTQLAAAPARAMPETMRFTVDADAAATQ